LGVAVQDGQLSTATTNYRFDQAAFAFQGMVGLDAKLCDRLTFFSEYRFFGNTETSLENADIAPPMEDEIGRFHYSADNVLFGLRVNY
jgi:opacity protein-like surface antigen